VEQLEVSTVDGFQGREKECIIISMVRSNEAREVGFLSDFRRMNVAITRARRFVCLIGDSECVGSDPFLARLTAYFQEKGEYRSGMDYAADNLMGVHLDSQRKKEAPSGSSKQSQG